MPLTHTVRVSRDHRGYLEGKRRQNGDEQRPASQGDLQPCRFPILQSISYLDQCRVPIPILSILILLSLSM